jgi:hypothetical protein
MEFAGLCAIEGLTISAATLRQAPPAIALELVEKLCLPVWSWLEARVLL